MRDLITELSLLVATKTTSLVVLYKQKGTEVC